MHPILILLAEDNEADILLIREGLGKLFKNRMRNSAFWIPLVKYPVKFSPDVKRS